jgi:predicted GTPase
MKDLEATIRQVPCDSVVIGTPIDLRRVITIEKPCTRVTYSLQETTKPDLAELLAPIVKKARRKKAQ